MPSLRSVLPLPLPLALALALLALVGCQREPTPQLLQVLDVTPREAEVGERLEIAGNGFPQGRTAHVTFRGTLYRPGFAKVSGAEVVATGTVTSAQQIEVPFTEALEGLFCGAGEAKAHTTFEGEVEVAFTAAAPGAPPVAGTLSKALLDVRPPTPRRGVEEARIAEGDRVLGFAGVTVAPNAPPSGGLLIASVAPGSPAEEAGLLAGDLVVSFDHVRVHGPDDVLLAPHAKDAEVGVRRDGSPREEMRLVRVQGASSAGPGELVGAAVVLVLAAGLVLLLFAPPWSAATWIERRIAARLAARSTRPTVRGTRAYVLAGAITTAYAALPLAQRALGTDLDIGILFLLSVTALVTMGLFEGPSASPFGIMSGLRGAARVASYVAPGALAVVSIVVMTGSLRVEEIVRAQGGLPWQWYAFRSPISFALFVLLLATAIAPGSRRPIAFPEALADAPPRKAATTRADGSDRAAPPRAFPYAERVYTYVVGGVGSALFLGGWDLPFAAPGAELSSLGLALVGGALFAAKAWVVVALIAATRITLPRRRIDETAGLSLRYLVPSALAMLALTAAWVAWSPARGVQTIVSASMFALFCVAIAHLATRVRYHLRSSGGGLSLNPFL